MASNEEIINNLTKDLQNSCIEKEQPEVDESAPHSSKSETSTHSDDAEDNDSTSQTKADDHKEDEADLVDEASLEDRDALLSTEEKEAFLKEALVHKNKGNEEFKNKNYLESVTCYSEGLQICPLMYKGDRSVLYANRAASKHKLGRKETAIQDCTKAIELNSDYVKAYLRRAALYEETEKLDEALEDYKKILELDPGNKEAIGANVRLPPIINERNEKLKTEMLGKLKDLGNMVLRPFGLSTNNFQMTQDPSTGGYSINFKPSQ